MWSALLGELRLSAATGEGGGVLSGKCAKRGHRTARARGSKTLVMNFILLGALARSGSRVPRSHAVKGKKKSSKHQKMAGSKCQMSDTPCCKARLLPALV